MKVYVVPVPSTGHLFSFVPTCWALRAEGHEVLVASRPDLNALARAAGIHTVDIDGLDAPLDKMRAIFTEEVFPATPFGQRDTPQGEAMWQFAASNWFTHAEQHLDSFLAPARRWRPDLVVTDPLALVGRMVGASLRVPTVVHRWGVDPTGASFTRTAEPMLAGFSERLGLGPLAEPAMLVDVCPPTLQALDAKPGRAVRYAPYNGSGSLPDWVGTARPTTHHVAICFGSTVLSMAGPRSLRNVLAALDGIPDLTVTAAFTSADRAIVGDLPDTVRVMVDAPTNLFLAECDLLIHHGGTTTALTGVHHGLPQLVLPQLFDQFDYGQRLAAAGAGIAMLDRDSQSDVDGLRAAVERLLTDPAYGTAARGLSAEMAATPPVATLVPELVALARRS